MGPFPMCISRLTSFSLSMIHTLRSSLRFHKRGSFVPVDPNSCLAVPASNSKFKSVLCKCAPRERFCLKGTRLCHHPSFYLIGGLPPDHSNQPSVRHLPSCPLGPL